MTPIESHAIALSLEARIAVLWRQHQRDKGLAYWTPALVGRGEDEMAAARRWKSRALRAEARVSRDAAERIGRA